MCVVVYINIIYTQLKLNLIMNITYYITDIIYYDYLKSLAGGVGEKCNKIQFFATDRQ